MISKMLDFSVPENCVCFNLRWVTRAVTQFFDAEMRRHGIRPTQGTILLALNAKESWTMAELSDCLGLERTTLVRNLRPLQRDGLVTADGGGRCRRVELAITAKGRKQVEKFMPGLGIRPEHRGSGLGGKALVGAPRRFGEGRFRTQKL